MVTNTTLAMELVETGEQRDRIGRRITPAARRAELVAAWRASGLTQAAFARREGVKYTTFTNWVQVRAKAGAAKPAVRFAEVRLPLPLAANEGRVAALEVRWPDGTVLRGGSATELAKLVRALRA
jgi:hypothetical protein